MLAFTALWSRPLTPLLRITPYRLQARKNASYASRFCRAPLRVRAIATVASDQVNVPEASLDSSDRHSSSMFTSSTSFKDLGVSEDIANHLAIRGITTPTHAQAAIVPLLLEGMTMQADYALKVRAAAIEAESVAEASEIADSDVDTISSSVDQSEEQDANLPKRDPRDVNDVLMFGAETGSGKTLSYLLPFVEATTRTKLPLKAVILVPSRELCAQTAQFLTTYFPRVPPHVILAGGTPPDAAAMRGVRILIATPTALLVHLRFSQRVDTSDKLIVVDEADMLLSGSFERDVAKVLDQPGMKPFATRRNGPLRARNANRLVFVGATYPHWTGEKVRSVVTWLRRRYPDIRSVQTDGLHRRNERLMSRWRFEPSVAERILAVAEILQNDVVQGDKVMVFCGKAESAREVHDAITSRLGREYMEDKFGGAVELHKLVDSRERVGGLLKFRDGQSRLLFCTDLAARGLDLGDVTRVIEFDFSQNVVNYLHRIGRTARAGARGATDHFYNEVSKPLAEAIREKAETERSVVEGVFSRRRSFRRKLKRRLQNEAASGEGDGVAATVRTINEDEIDEIDDEERARWQT